MTSDGSLVRESWLYQANVGSLDSTGKGLPGPGGSPAAVVGTMGSHMGVLLPELSTSTGADSDGGGMNRLNSGRGGRY